MKKETIYKTIAIIVIPGGIPIFLAYKAFQFSKELYKKNKPTHKGDKNNEKDTIGDERDAHGGL